jgi:hypothetical protein
MLVKLSGAERVPSFPQSTVRSRSPRARADEASTEAELVGGEAGSQYAPRRALVREDQRTLEEATGVVKAQRFSLVAFGAP